MVTTALMAFLHHLLAFSLTACLVYEFIAYREYGACRDPAHSTG